MKKAIIILVCLMVSILLTTIVKAGPCPTEGELNPITFECKESVFCDEHGDWHKENHFYAKSCLEAKCSFTNGTVSIRTVECLFNNLTYDMWVSQTDNLVSNCLSSYGITKYDKISNPEEGLIINDNYIANNITVYFCNCLKREQSFTIYGCADSEEFEARRLKIQEYNDKIKKEDYNLDFIRNVTFIIIIVLICSFYLLLRYRKKK
jgi:hypothetical protein